MERDVEELLNRISFISAAVATLSLLYLFSNNSFSCQPPNPHPHLHPHALTQTLAHTPFPKSSCESGARHLVHPDNRTSKLHSSRDWRRRVDSFSALFRALRELGVLKNASSVLCVSAGAGHEVAALLESGVEDVTGVDLIDFPPLVSRSDPHNLPFFDGVFDLGFSTGLDVALFPSRFVSEMERTVRVGGVSVLAMARCSSEEEVEGVTILFRRSRLVGLRNVTLVGSEMTVVIMRHNALPP